MDKLLVVNNGPYDAEIEYLESTGTQYIETDVYGSGTVGFEVKFNLTSLRSPGDANSATIFGARQTHNSNGLQLSTFDSGTVQMGGTLNRQKGITTINTNYTVRLDSNGLTVNGNSAGTINTATFTTPYPLYIFALKESGGIKEHLSGKIYYIKFFDKTTLAPIAEYIPVRIGTTGYLYEKITKELYGNDGSGVFTLGPDTLRTKALVVKTKPYDAEIEYLESTGTQYINTGITNITTSDEFSLVASVSDRGYPLVWGFSTSSVWFDVNMYHSSKQLLEFAWGVTGVFLNLTAPQTGVYVNFESKVENGRVHFYVDGVDKGDLALTTDNSNRGHYLFARNSNGTVTFFKGRIKKFSYKRNGVLICDYKPVRVGQVGYMYDSVSGQLFGNAGTGSFTLGPDVRVPKFALVANDN